MIENAPDAFVVTDLDGVVLSANRAFVDLAQLASEAQVRGQSLERWLGRTGVDLNVLITNLRQRGAVRLFAAASSHRPAGWHTTSMFVPASKRPESSA